MNKERKLLESIYGKRKIKVIPLSWGLLSINIYVRDNRQIGITCLEYNDFEIMDKDGNIFNPYACTENQICYYELLFNEMEIDKIRIKKYGFTSRFIKIE